MKHNRGMNLDPSLERATRAGVDLIVDRGAGEQGLVVAFSDRSGGVSPAPFDSLNLSTRTDDEAETVAENRRRLATATGLTPGSLVFAHQVHGCDVVDATVDTDEERPGDVLVSDRPGVAIAVLTADCVPILVAGEDRVVAIHAGWRGLVAGAIERGLAAAGTPIAAWVGPSIRSCCYEVGPDVVSAFEDRNLPVADSWHVDPGRAAFAILKRSGVEAVASASDCTSCDRRYFSYRRDRTTGRQSGLIARL